MNKFLEESPLNQVKAIGLSRIFDAPLLGVALASDPLFEELKDPAVIGSHHRRPTEWLPGAKSVISYFLPFSTSVREANRVQGLPATEWLYGRIEGEACNNALRSYLVDLLAQAGVRAIAPVLDSGFEVVNKRSNWSERHVAFIAGLGTFGLSKSLITKKGSAGRYGSVITDLELEPTPRNYKDVYEYCTFCGECIGRCPSGAIKPEGKDIWTCSAYLDTQIKPRYAPRYGCGKCQTAVACEYEMP